MAKIIAYCEGVMEAAWLTAVISVPLFFTAWGESHESEKNYLMRSLAGVLLTAWVVKGIAQSGSRPGASDSTRVEFRNLLRAPLVLPALILGAIMAGSTVFSLSPWISFWGVWFRRLGSCSYLCCLLFFVAIAATIRSNVQIQRVITAIILTTIPICLYAIGQRFSIEPLMAREGSNADRVASTFGNPVYLAAYLGMVLPLTMARVLEAALRIRRQLERRFRPRAELAIYVVTAILQTSAIAFSFSRGPFIAVAAAVFLMFLMLGVGFRKRRCVWATIGGALLLFAAFMLALWPNGPFRNFATRPGIERFSKMLGPQADTSGRNAIWKLAVQAASYSKIVESGQGTKDSFSWLRPWIGYGPEQVWLICRLYRAQDYNAGILRGMRDDRLHNDFWDALIATGLVGLAASWGLGFLVVYYGCKWLGFAASPRQRTVFWTCFLGGGVAGSLALIAWQGLSFVGIGLRLGTCMGLVAFLAQASLSRDDVSGARSVPMVRVFLVISLLSGAIAHLIETAFSFDIETTLLYFWIYLALMLAAGHRRLADETVLVASDPSDRNVAPLEAPRYSPEKSVPAKFKGNRSKPLPAQSNPGGFSLRRWRTDIALGTLVGAVLVNFGATLLRQSSATSAVSTIGQSLTRLSGDHDAFTWWLLLGTLVCWIVFAAGFASENGAASGSKARSLAVILTVSGTIGLLYWVSLANNLSGLLPLDRAGVRAADRYLSERFYNVNLYYLSIFGIVSIAGAFLRSPIRGGPSPLAHFRRFKPAGMGLAAIAGMALIYSTQMKWSRVGAMDHWADSLELRGQLTLAAAICEKAIQIAPNAENHYLILGRNLMKQADVAKTTEERQVLLQRADTILAAGTQLRPLDPAFPARRANLYLKWAEYESRADRRRALGERAVELNQEAAHLDPSNDDLWYRMAYVAMAILRSPDRARPWLERSLELYPNAHTTHGLLGDVLFYQGVASKVGTERESLFRSAAAQYQEALKQAPGDDSGARFRYGVALGKAHAELRETDQAIAAYRAALGFAAPAERWTLEESLGRLYADAKDRAKATEHFQKAIELAPPDQKPGVSKRRDERLANP